LVKKVSRSCAQIRTKLMEIEMITSRQRADEHERERILRRAKLRSAARPSGAKTIPDIARIEREGFLILPRGWASSFEHRLASFAAFLTQAEIRYESGRRVPLATLERGWIGTP
jgi:hypothetical protein